VARPLGFIATNARGSRLLPWRSAGPDCGEPEMERGSWLRGCGYLILSWQRATAREGLRAGACLALIASTVHIVIQTGLVLLFCLRLAVETGPKGRGAVISCYTSTLGPSCLTCLHRTVPFSEPRATWRWTLVSAHSGGSTWRVILLSLRSPPAEEAPVGCGFCHTLLSLSLSVAGMGLQSTAFRYRSGRKTR